MELAIIISLTLALGTLLVSRIHFHFSFNMTISRRGATGQVHAPRSRATIRRASRQTGDLGGGTPSAAGNSSVLPPETAGAWQSPRSGGTSPNKSSSIRDLGV